MSAQVFIDPTEKRCWGPWLTTRFAVSVRLHLSYIKAYLNGGSIISPLEWTTLPPSSTNLCESVLSLAQLYTDLISIPDSEFTLFTAMEWSRPIIGTIMGVRLSFDLAKCPEYDAQFARRHLGLEAFLDHMSRDLTPTSKAVDILSASRLVMGVVREKYQQRAGQLKPSPGLCCPMLDGTLDPYWETVFHTNMTPPTADELDLWTTVTMEWADDEGRLDADMALFS